MTDRHPDRPSRHEKQLISVRQRKMQNHYRWSFFVDKMVLSGNAFAMVKAITSLFLVLAIGFGPMATVQAQTARSKNSFQNFQRTLNQISQNRKGVAAQNQILSAYARFARFNPNQVFALVRMATVAFNKVTPIDQRAAGVQRMADASSAAFVAANTNDTSLIITTFTYLVSSVPAGSRTPEVIVSIGQAAVNASEGTGGTPEDVKEIINAVVVSNGGSVPTS